MRRGHVFLHNYYHTNIWNRYKVKVILNVHDATYTAHSLAMWKDNVLWVHERLRSSFILQKNSNVTKLDF